MASVSEKLDRRVIPNWRSYVETVNNGELEHSSVTQKLNSFDLTEYVHNWKETPNVIYAGELLSAAISNGVDSNVEAINAANYLLTHEKNVESSLVKIASYYLRKDSSEQEKANGLSIDIIEEAPIYAQIKYLKSKIKEYPYNPINYVEAARYYTMIGQLEQAKAMFEIALHLDGVNRYISRSAARFYVHCGDIEHAHHVLKSNESIKTDPWLIASEISVNLLRGRSSSLIGIARDIIDSGNYSAYSLTELQSSLATLELIKGTRKKSKRLFEQSLTAPDDNSLAQAEWAMRNDIYLRVDERVFSSVSRRYEANTMQYFYQEKYKEALGEVKKWVYDMPYSKEPIFVGADLGYTFLKDFDSAQKILSFGLVAHPNDAAILNNLAYAYALDNKLQEAGRVVEKLDALVRANAVDERNSICITATKGLLQYRLKNIEEGRRLYGEAIIKSSSLGENDYRYNWKAILNFCREEIRATHEAPVFLPRIMETISEQGADKEIAILLEDVKTLAKVYGIN